MFHDNELINIWINDLLEENGIIGITNLTDEILDEEIDDILGTIKNEHLWALGAPTSEAAQMHEDNAETQRKYIEYLKELKNNIKSA